MAQVKIIMLIALFMLGTGVTLACYALVDVDSLVSRGGVHDGQ